MSDLSAAASLSLKIETGAAKQELGELRQAYEALKKELANGMRAVGGSSELIQQLKTSQAEVDVLRAKIAEFKTSSGQMWVSYSASIEGGRATAKKALENMTNDTVIELSKQQKAEAEHVKKMATMSSTSVLKAQGEAAIENARRNLAQRESLHSDEYVSEVKAAQRLLQLKETTRAQLKLEQELELQDLVKAQARSQAVANQNSALSSKSMLKAYDEAALENARINLAQREALYSDQYVAEATASERLVQLKQATRAQLKLEQELEASDRAKALAKEKADADQRSAIAAAQVRDLKLNSTFSSASARSKLSKATAAADMLGAGYGEAALHTYGSEALQASNNLNTLRQAAEAVGATSAKAGESALSAAANQQYWNKAATEGHALARGLSGSLGTLWITYGSLLPLLAGAALGSGFVQAAKKGSEFAYQLTFVKALSDETAESVAALSAAALDLGTTSLQGPSQIASGFRILAQAGLVARDSLSSMPHVLHLATVGEMEMEQAATTLVGVMNAFNLTASDSEHIGDIFAKAAALSQTSVQGMTEAMKYASVVGEQYGANIEDTATAITLLAKVNITGTSAGTAFRNMLKELYSPTAAAAGAIEQLKLKTTDSNGNLRNFVDIIYDLKTTIEGYDKGSQVNILQKIFGERGAKEAIAMMAMTRDKWDELRSSIANSDGFMGDVSKQLEDTTKGQWTQALNTLEADLIKVFQDLEPELKGLAVQIKDLFSSDEFKEGLTAAVSGMATLTKLAVDAAPAVLQLVEAFAIYKAGAIAAHLATAAWATVTGVAGLTGSVTVANGVVTLFGQTLSAVAAGQATTLAGTTGLSAAMGMLGGPIGIVTGLLTAGTLAWAIYGDSATKHLDSVTKQAESLQGTIQNLSNLLNDISIGKLGRDASTRAILDGYRKLNDEEAAFKKEVEAQFGGSVDLDLNYNIKNTGPSSLNLAAFPQFNDTRKKLLEAREKLEEASRANADRAVGENGELDLTSGGKEKGQPLKHWAGAGAGGTKAGRSMSDYALQNDTLKSELQRIKEEVKGTVTALDDIYNQGVIRTEDYIRQKFDMEWEALEQQQVAVRSKLDSTTDANLRTKLGNDLLELAAQKTTLVSAAQRDLNKSYFEEKRVRAELTQTSLDAMNQAEYEIGLIGKTTIEQEKLNIARKAELDLRNKTRNADGSFRTNASAEGESALKAAMGENVKRDQETAQRRYDESRTFESGWSKAFAAYREEAGNSAKVASDAFQQGTSIMEDSIYQFTTNSKNAYQSMTQSILKYIAQIAAKQAAAGLMGLIANVATTALSAYGSSSGSGVTTSSPSYSGVGGSGSVSLNTGSGGNYGLGGQYVSLNQHALGGVYDSPSLSAFSSGVYDSPQFFAFAKGAGVFAEAGPEAIMPLARDSQGRLGVRNGSGGGGAGDVNIEVNVTIEGNGASTQDTRSDSGTSAKQLGDLVANVTKKTIIEEMRSGGLLSGVRN